MEHRRALIERNRFLVILVFAAVLGACATATVRINQFEGFAQAGTRFADTVPPVLDEAFRVSVATDSLVLTQARMGLRSSEDRLKAIEQSNRNLAERIAILNDLKRQASLLGAYFVALQALAHADADSSGMTEVASGIVGALGKLSPGIANAKIGGSPVSDFLAPVVSLTFTAFQSAALNHELKKNGAIIERQLNLQQAALTATADAMRAELEIHAAAADRDSIVLPFVRDGTLPSDWAQRRTDAFQRHIQLRSVDAAAKAAQNLRSSYVALVENRLDETHLTALQQDINGIVTVLEGVKARQ